MPNVRNITPEMRRHFYSGIGPRISSFPGCCGAGILSRLMASSHQSIEPFLRRIPSSYSLVDNYARVANNISRSLAHGQGRYVLPVTLDLAFARVLSELVDSNKGIWHTIDASRSTMGDTVQGAITTRRFWTWLEEADAPVEMVHGEARNGDSGAWLESRVILFRPSTIRQYLNSVWWPKYIAYLQEMEAMPVARQQRGRSTSSNQRAADDLSVYW